MSWTGGAARIGRWAWVPAAALLGAGVIARAYEAQAAPRTPGMVRANLVRIAQGTREAPVGTSVRLDEVGDMEFASRRVGYALGGPQGSTFPLKTTNGGRNWFVDGPAFFLPIADGAAAVGDLAVASPGEAYAYGGGGSNVVVSTDAGKRWWRAFLGQVVVSVAQRGSDIWALAGGPTGAVDAPPAILLYDSSNGGRSWTYRSTLSGVRGWQADLQRPSAGTAFALVKAFGNDSPAAGGIVETTDGGRTWTKRADPCNQRFSKQRVNWTERLAAPTTTSLWLFCGGQPATGSETKLVERSQNGGRSWTLVASNAPGEHVPPEDIPLTGTLPDTAATGMLSVTSRSDAWLILIGNNTLWKTTDGGRRWTRGAPAKVEAQFPQQLSLAQGSVFVKTQNALWASSARGWELMAGTAKPY